MKISTYLLFDETSLKCQNKDWPPYDHRGTAWSTCLSRCAGASGFGLGSVLAMAFWCCASGSELRRYGHIEHGCQRQNVHQHALQTRQQWVSVCRPRLSRKCKVNRTHVTTWDVTIDDYLSFDVVYVIDVCWQYDDLKGAAQHEPVVRGVELNLHGF